MVEYAAKEVGMHVVEYNCYELLGSSDGKTAAALSQAFEVARRLFLRIPISHMLRLCPLFVCLIEGRDSLQVFSCYLASQTLWSLWEEFYCWIPFR